MAQQKICNILDYLSFVKLQCFKYANNVSKEQAFLIMLPLFQVGLCLPQKEFPPPFSLNLW